MLDSEERDGGKVLYVEGQAENAWACDDECGVRHHKLYYVSLRCTAMFNATCEQHTAADPTYDEQPFSAQPS